MRSWGSAIAAPVTRGAVALVAATALLVCVSGSPVAAQIAPHPTTGGSSIPSVPAGAATIRGRVVDPDRSGATGGLDVALYALGADGTPGLAQAKTGPDGGFSFTGVSGDPGIVYLVGVRYAEVPYGQRVGFAPGQHEIDVEVGVSLPISRVDAITVAESTLKIEWLGTQLAIQERHRVANSGTAPVFVPASARAGVTPPFQALLPPGAEDFRTAPFNGANGFEQRGRELSYWGPIYPGEQELRYSYLVPTTSGAPLELQALFPHGTGRLRVLTPEGGPRISSDRMRPAESIDLEGRSFGVLESDPLPPGTRLALAVTLPKTTRDPKALRLEAVELTVELDDTVLEVTQRNSLAVAPGAHLAGGPDEPLVRFELPPGAELAGLSTGADQLGARETDEGIGLFGPLGPGTHELAFRYRLATTRGAAQLDLRFPLEVPTLTLLVADTGLTIESERLHRLRPRPLGTRTWLVREAFHVEPDEPLPVRFEAITRAPLPRLAAMAIVLAFGALAMLFVAKPLRATREDASEIEAFPGTARERELIYTTIRDLEHDFETGKLTQPAYARSRYELRARAVELLRDERAGVAAAEIPSPTGDGRFCRHCGAQAATAWHFCSACGTRLEDPSRARGEPAG
jgi:hypothetical protein